MNGKTLTARAEMLTDKVQRMASGSLGMMLGADGKATLHQLAELVEDMAREIEKGKA